VSRHSDHRLRTICEVCRQWVRIKDGAVRHHSRPHRGSMGGKVIYCPGSGAPVIWTAPKSEQTRGRPADEAGEDK